MKKKKKKQVRFWTLRLDCAIYEQQQMNGVPFIHPANFQVDLDSSLADLGDGEEAQGVFHLLLI